MMRSSATAPFRRIPLNGSIYGKRSAPGNRKTYYLFLRVGFVTCEIYFLKTTEGTLKSITKWTTSVIKGVQNVIKGILNVMKETLRDFSEGALKVCKGSLEANKDTLKVIIGFCNI